MKLVALITISLLAATALAQPQQCNAPTGTGCPVLTSCTSTGSAAHYKWNTLNPTWDANNRLSVSMTTNTCPASSSSFKYNGVALSAPVLGQPCCTAVTLPQSAYVDPNGNAKAAPLRGAVGYTLTGTNIYGPMDAGFSAGQACSVTAGTCAAGTDLQLCTAILEKTCGTANLKTTMFLDDCGGHASPYHFHSDLNCQYNVNDATGHSKLIGIALDGRGIYGKWESANTLPTLDACGGHWGPTPALNFTDSAGQTVVIPAQSNAYHYHIIAGGPNTIACFGGTTANAMINVAQAKALYTSCGDGFTNYCTSKGAISYDLDCPVFNQLGVGGTYNLNYTPTATCPSCTGNCPYGTSAAVVASSAPAQFAMLVAAALLAALMM